MYLRSRRFIIPSKTLTPKKRRLRKLSTKIDRSFSENKLKSVSFYLDQEKLRNRNKHFIGKTRTYVFETLVLLMLIVLLAFSTWYFYSEMKTFLLSDFAKIFRTLK
jgi:uncharacterized membrane protein YukC